MQINPTGLPRTDCSAMAKIHRLPDKWLPVSIAPSDSDLEVCVIDRHGIHALVFPCRKKGTGWADAATSKWIDIQPTHWRVWREDRETES
jgi:hypothetical protein